METRREKEPNSASKILPPNISKLLNDAAIPPTSHSVYSGSRERYKSQTASTFAASLGELKALFGLPILAPALKGNHLSTKLLQISSYYE
nr:unnamed protein product [Callosobruchus analis]